MDGQPVAVAGFWKSSNALCVSPFVTDPTRLSWDLISESFIAKAVERGLKQIELPLVGEGQPGLIRSLENRCHISSCRKLSLMRKPL